MMIHLCSHKIRNFFKGRIWSDIFPTLSNLTFSDIHLFRDQNTYSIRYLISLLTTMLKKSSMSSTCTSHKFHVKPLQSDFQYYRPPEGFRRSPYSPPHWISALFLGLQLTELHIFSPYWEAFYFKSISSLDFLDNTPFLLIPLTFSFSHTTFSF